EVDRGGKEVQTIELGQAIVAARRLPDRQIVAFDGNQVIRFDKSGREIKRTALNVFNSGCGEVLDNGHVLVACPLLGGLVEYNADGKEVGRLNLPGILQSFRLPNGHTLVLLGPRKVVEFDEKWEQVQETPLANPTDRVKRY